MKTSEHTDKIDAALAKAQAELQNPVKDAVNPHFRSKYATLDAGLNIVRACLSKHGISFSQLTRIDGNVLMLDTRIAFQGQWIASEYPISPFPVKQQELGSALTYARRYSLFAMVGVAGEEDDDANAATTPQQAPKREPAPAKPVLPPEDSEKVYRLMADALMTAESVSEIDKFLSDNLKSIETLNDNHKALLRKAIKDLRSEMTKAA